MSTQQSHGAHPAKCQSCHRTLETPVFCDNCRSLIPAERVDHFELLGLPVRFELDAGQLRQRYLQLSRWVHPDHHGNGGDTELSLHLAAQLNEAYRVLGDPVLRAEYLLELSGGKSSAEEKGVLPDVLTNTLMLRDDALEARAAGDADTLKRCRGEARQLYDAMLARIRTLAATLPAADDATRRELRAALNSIKYYHKLLADL